MKGINYMMTKVTDGIYRKNVRYESLDQLIKNIRSNENRKMIDQYRSIKGRKKAKQFKKRMPMFEVCINHSCPEGLRSNGLVYFDIDKKDNPNINIEELKNSIISLPATKFAFFSPSGGLKFAIQTDFIKEVSEAAKARYKSAYDLVHQWLLSKFSFNHDRAVRMLTATCFTSYDPVAYFCENPVPFLIKDQIRNYEETEFQSGKSLAVIPESYAEELFLSVPSNVSYQDILICNYMIMKYSPLNAEFLILNHWDKDNRKLKQNIASQKRNASFGSIKAVQKIVLDNGGKLPSSPNHGKGAQRKLMIAEQCDHRFDDLLEPDAAKELMENQIERFFDEKVSMCLRVSAGFGKTESVLKSIARHASSHKIAYFAPTHNLLDEAETRYIELSKRDGTYQWHLKPNHIYSRSGTNSDLLNLCNNTPVRERYRQEQRPIRYTECLNCHFNGECNYVEQFNNTSNITFRPTINLFNRKGVWEDGSSEYHEEDKKSATYEVKNPDGSVELEGKTIPRKNASKPDFIIVDENVLHLDRFSVDGNAKSKSLKLILLDLHEHRESNDSEKTSFRDYLSQSVKNHLDQVIDDYDDLHDQWNSLRWRTGEFYFDALQNFSEQEFSILEALYRFVVSGCEKSELYGFTFVTNQEGVGKLSLGKMRHVADHYQDIPVLVLDATANEMVMRQIFPEIEFHAIDVKPNGNVKVYQCQNATFSRDFLKDTQVIDRLIEQMNDIIRDCEASKVGLITYLNVGKIGNFDKFLAEKLDHKNVIFRHFGDTRGTNKLGDVDVFFQIGKQQMSYQDTVAQAEAVFHTDLDQEMVTVPVPVRMSDGGSMALSNRIFSDERVMAVYDQLSRSETIQAVARSRPIFGSEKSVYLFTNEALGGDIAVTNFLDFDHPYAPPYWENLIKRGFVRTKTSFMRELGYTEKQLQNGGKQKVILNFTSRGCEIVSVSFKNRHYKNEVHEYLVYDKVAFDKLCEESEWVILVDQDFS